MTSPVSSDIYLPVPARIAFTKMLAENLLSLRIRLDPSANFNFRPGQFLQLHSRYR
jgi:NAD(P)H-flavin reductase